MLKLLFLIFIGYLLYLIVRPMFKVWRTVSKVKKGDFSAFADFFGQPGAQKSSAAYNPDGSRKSGWSKGRMHRKKIGKDVGEYVKFSEITLTDEERAMRDNTVNTHTTYTTEQQITDIEWEDIK